MKNRWYVVVPSCFAKKAVKLLEKNEIFWGGVNTPATEMDIKFYVDGTYVVLLIDAEKKAFYFFSSYYLPSKTNGESVGYNEFVKEFEGR